MGQKYVLRFICLVACSLTVKGLTFPNLPLKYCFVSTFLPLILSLVLKSNVILAFAVELLQAVSVVVKICAER